MACDPKASRIHGTDTHPKHGEQQYIKEFCMPVTGIYRDIVIFIYIGFYREAAIWNTFAVTPSHLNSGEFPVKRTVKPISAKAILRRTSNSTKSLTIHFCLKIPKSPKMPLREKKEKEKPFYCLIIWIHTISEQYHLKISNKDYIFHKQLNKIFQQLTPETHLAWEQNKAHILKHWLLNKEADIKPLFHVRS